MEEVTVRKQDQYAMPRLCCACGAPAGTQTLSATHWPIWGKYIVSLPFPLCDQCALANATVDRRREIGCFGALGLSILLCAAAFGMVSIVEGSPGTLLEWLVGGLVILAPLTLLGGFIVGFDWPIGRWIVSLRPKELRHTYRRVSRAVRMKRYAAGFIRGGRITFVFGNEQFANLFKQMNAGAVLDEKGRRGIRWGTLIFLLVVAVLIFAGWTILPKDAFEDIVVRVIETLHIARPTPAVATPSPAVITHTVQPQETPAMATPSPAVITYTVQAGDTLAKIAAEFGVTVEEITEANDIEDPSLISVGQVLVIPKP